MSNCEHKTLKRNLDSGRVAQCLVCGRFVTDDYYGESINVNVVEIDEDCQYEYYYTDKLTCFGEHIIIDYD